MGVDSRREGSVESRSTAGEAGAESKECRGWRRDGALAGDLSVASGSRAGDAESYGSRVGGDQTIWAGGVGGSREQEAAEWRTPHKRLRCVASTDGARQGTALAWRFCRDQTACRGFRNVSVSPKVERFSGADGCDTRRAGAVHVGAGFVRIRG